MNITRILGQNNKIYQKFGDYCITEAEPNQCCIICCFCQEEHHSEQTFWAHVQEVHDYAPARLFVMHEKPILANCNRGCGESRSATPSSIGGAPTRTTTKAKLPQPAGNDAPMYIEAEYLEDIVLNEPNAMLEINDITRTFFDFKEKKLNDAKSTAATGNEEKENVQQLEHNESSKAIQSPRLNGAVDSSLVGIDIDKLSPKQFLENGKLLKSLFQQMQRVNNEFKYKLNKLTQAVQLIESELKKEPGSRTLKRYMKIIPDQPFTSRDEVLILDDELHHSKEMRDALHEETLAINTENADVFCRLLWRFIMTDEVSNQFCWRGVVNVDKVIKYPIKDMTMLDVFQGVFREKFPQQTLHFFKDRTMTYFNKAHERLKRKQLNKVDGSSFENNGYDLLCNNESAKEQESDYKRARSEAKHIEVAVDSVYEEVFCE